MTVLRSSLWLRVSKTVLALAIAAIAVRFGLTTGGACAIAGVAGALFCVAIAARYWRLRVIVSPDELRLVNWRRSVTLPWADVRRCGYDGALWIRLSDGELVRPSALASPPIAFGSARRAGHNAAIQLEQLRRSRRRRETLAA